MIATSLEVSLLILTIEFALIAVAIAFYSYRGVRTTEAETTADATELVSKVTDTEESRRSALETVFKVKYQYEGDELTAMVDEFMQREKAFYNAVVGAFLGRDKNKLSDLNDELTKVVAPWISMTPKNMVDPKEAESLAVANSLLKTELGETKEVLEEMIAEYNRTFHIEEPAQDAAEAPQDKPVEDEVEKIEEVVAVASSDATDHIEESAQDAADTPQDKPAEDHMEKIEEVVAAVSSDATDDVEAGAAEVKTPDPTTEILDELNEPDESDTVAEAPVDQVMEK